MITTKQLEKLGLKTAGKKLGRAKRLEHAYGNYGHVPQGAIDAFNERLKKDTMIEDPRSYTYKKLMFVKLEEYTEIPPKKVLGDLKKAYQDKCFDFYEIAKIDWVKVQKDPILFGRIEGCPDRFFISQWDDDVNIEDILRGSQDRNIKIDGVHNL